MIITAKADGTLIKTVPDRVYQGSNNADTIIVIAPIIQTAVMNIRFKKPQINEYTPNFLMTPANANISSDLGVSVWTYSIKSELTQYYGTVQAQFSATVNGSIVSSGQFTFEVEKGVEVVLPDPAQPNRTYDDIYNYLQNMATKIFINGELQAKAILPYDATFKYGLGATLFDNGRFYTSLVANNQNNALTDTTKWQETRFYTKSETDTIIADMELAISNIIDGTTPVAEATHATSATNVAITNNDTGNNANVNFNIGTGAYNKTINNVANATSASDYNVGGTIDRELKLIKHIALDRENALVFDNTQQIIDWIAGTYQRTDGKTVADLTIGLTIYNRAAKVNTPNEKNYWVSQLPVTSISDLTPFESDVNPLDAIDVEFDASINENRLEADNVQEAIDELTNIADEKTNIYELGQFTLASTDWALNSTSGLYEYVFTNEYLTSATNEIIEVTPSVESAKLINSNNLVIYNDIEIRQGVSAVEAVIKSQSAPSFDIVCYVRLKTVAMRLSGAGSLRASQVIFVNTGTGLGATNVQDAIVEINNKANNGREITIWEASEISELSLGTMLGLIDGSLNYITLSSNIKPDTKYSIEYYVWSIPGIIKKVYFKTNSFGKSEISVRDFDIDTVNNVIDFRDVVISVGNDDELDKIKCVKACQKELNSQGILTDVTDSTYAVAITVSKISEIIE